VIEQQMARVRAELENARKRSAELLVRSPRAGTLLVPDARRLEGRYVHKGQVLGYVTDARPLTTRVVLRQDEIDRVREDTRAVRVKLPGYPDRTFAGRIDGGVPSATRTLPGAALGARGGGRIAVDADDREGRTPADSVFVLDVTLPADAPRLPAGTRVYLRFEHGGAALAVQVARAARRLLLARWGV
jgi:putative peptide zinc metalloprotease protein